MTTPRIEEMVEECLPKSRDLQKVGDHYWGGDYEPTYYELINLEASFREILKPRLRQALTQAHQAGIDEAVEIVDDRCNWYNTNNQIPESELSKGDEHWEMIQNVVKDSLAEVNQRIKDDIKALQDKK